MNSKVDRLIAEYELSGLGDELADSWIGNNGEQRSLRELAEVFNERLLRAAMADAGMSILDGEVANTYRLLTADDVSTGVRTQAETTLERDGIDPTELQRDFVSHQAIHTYLTKHRGIERPTQERDPVSSAENTIQRLTGRLVAVVEKRLRSLRNGGVISLGTFSVLVDVRVVCEDCGTHADARALLANGGCDCEDT